MIADVIFDLPLHRAFAYAVPPDMKVAVGQRVRAALQGRPRAGIVVALRDGAESGLRPVQERIEPVPIVSEAALAVSRWAARESLCSWGATLSALLPPLPRPHRGEIVAPPAALRGRDAPAPELWVGSDDGERLAALLARAREAALVIVPDVVAAAQWAHRLDAARLDSGATNAERRGAWFAASAGRRRVVVGTRSALLAPLPPPALMAIVDEHDPAHKPPGAPRIHARDVLVQRARIEGDRLLLLSPTPTVESWWRAARGDFRLTGDGVEAWPELVAADTRGILPRHPLTPLLSRIIGETTRAGRRVVLVVSRVTGALGCEDCATVMRCPDCGLALGYSPAEQRLACRVCARAQALPSICPGCGGHRLASFGWGADRVEAAVRRRFPRLSVSRQGLEAQVVIGTSALLRGAARGGFGAVGFISLDTLLHLPDFRAAERAFQMLWAAALAVGPTGRVVVQTLQPDHYALRAAREGDRRQFYECELGFRSELGYPPFRRLCIVRSRGRGADGGRALALECAERLSGIPDVSAYAPAPVGAPGAARRQWRLVLKGPLDLPERIGPALLPFLERRRRSGGVVEVDVDPLSLT